MGRRACAQAGGSPGRRSAGRYLGGAAPGGPGLCRGAGLAARAHQKLGSGMSCRRRDISSWPVMVRAQCSTCPFLKDERGRYLNPELAAKVESRLLSTSQLCHHPSLSGKPETHFCPGGQGLAADDFLPAGRDCCAYRCGLGSQAAGRRRDALKINTGQIVVHWVNGANDRRRASRVRRPSRARASHRRPTRGHASRHNIRRNSDAATKADSSRPSCSRSRLGSSCSKLGSSLGNRNSRSRDHRNSRRRTRARNNRCQKRK
jgi:hypothetical protein